MHPETAYITLSISPATLYILTLIRMKCQIPFFFPTLKLCHHYCHESWWHQAFLIGVWLTRVCELWHISQLT